jgi:cytochrome c-type biogenesis protein CcmH
VRPAAAVAAALLCLAAAPAPNPSDEARAQALFAEVRCVVCQNESIESSQAEIAADLRTVVREQVAAGRSDREIRAFLVARYGEFVMFRPAFSPANALLWLGPFLVVLGGLAAVAARSRRVQPTAALSPEELERLRALQAAEPINPKVT